MKNKSRVLSYFIKNDCKVGTVYRNKNGTKTRTIIYSWFRGIFDTNTHIEIVVEDESGNLYRDFICYNRDYLGDFTSSEANAYDVSLIRSVQLGKLSNNKIYIYI
jgi:hypothetical protein